MAIERAIPASDVKTRVENLTDCITYQVFMYTTRGLFECDKLIFTAQMAFQGFQSRLSAALNLDLDLIASNLTKFENLYILNKLTKI